MSKSVVTASEKEQDESQKDSVFDFLYYDSQRVGSFLAQFFDDGHLKEVLQKEAVNKVRERGVKLSAGGGVNIVGQGGNAAVGFELGPGDTAGEESHRKYDPLWANARTFLDYVEINNMINDDLDTTPIGRFIYFKGDLTVVDLGIAGKTWSKPSIQRLMTEAVEGNNEILPGLNRRDRRKLGIAPPKAPQMPQEVQLLVELMDVLPHTTQAYFTRDNRMLWCGLREEAMVVKAGDLLLKHGFAVEGEWAVLGILDGYPSASSAVSAEERMQALGIDGVDGGGMAANLMLRLAPIARNLLGRPPGAFGVTPLLIFREVSG